ncbi:unnamed protein product [Effrenium voratum]|uniref:Uncharacterized protein n=1 Tax=Effrenium voratum TaxID=2562239 RepID=A0AA36JG46_9DINO|nr:unnamed protein product [Effrenium voratum]
MTGGPVAYGDARSLGSTAAEELWKKSPDDEPRPLQIQYSAEGQDDQEIADGNVMETVFEDPNEAKIRPRLLVPLQSVLGLKALCEREYIRTEAVTETLNQCRTAYYKELLYLREQLILAAEPEKQLMLGAVQNYEVYFFNPPEYVDEDLKEYILNCSRWTHKKLIEENYELQVKLAGVGQNDVFENADFCLKGLLRRHGTYKLFKLMHSVVSNAKDLFNPEDMIRKRETEGLKPLDELKAAVAEAFPNLGAREDNSGALIAEINELQRTVADLRAELAKVKEMLSKERSRTEELTRKCEEQEKLLAAPEVPQVVESHGEDCKRMELEVEAQVNRMRQMITDLSSGKKYQIGKSAPDQSKVFPHLDEAILDLDKLFAKILAESPQILTKIQATTTQVVESVSDDNKKEIQELKKEIAVLKSKLAAAEQREQDALSKLKEPKPQEKKPPTERKVPESPSNTGATDNVDDLKKQLERKIARIADLEAELDQAQRDLRAAQRTIDEKDLLLQERARKDAEKAKQMSDLMEKLRKSEEEAEKLAGKLYNAQEKIKQLKEQIRELKNKLGMPADESDEEKEEEEEETPMFMSRYYLRAKNSGKPRWMLLAEDAKLKEQKKAFETKQTVAPEAPGQDATSALAFLRRGQSGESHGSKVRLQYSYTSTSLADPGDLTPGSSKPGFSRQTTFHAGVPLLEDGGPFRPVAHANSMPPGADGSPQRLSRAATSSSLRAGTPPGPGLPGYVSAGGAMVGPGAGWRSGGPSSGTAWNSSMLGHPSLTPSLSGIRQEDIAAAGLQFSRLAGGQPASLFQTAGWRTSARGPGQTESGPERVEAEMPGPAGPVIPFDSSASGGREFHRMNSSPSPCRVAHVGLAMQGPTSPKEGPMLQLVPQVSYGRGPVLEPLPQSSWSLLSPSGQEGDAGQSAHPTSTRSGETSAPRSGAISPPRTPERAREPPVPSPDVRKREPRDLKSECSTRATDRSQESTAPQIQHSPTVPLPMPMDLSSPSAAVERGPGSAKQPFKQASFMERGSQREAEADFMMRHSKSQPLIGHAPESSKVLSWAPRSKGTSSVPLTNGFKGKPRARTYHSLESPPVEYVHADALPRLPGGKVRKASPPSWLSPI